MDTLDLHGTKHEDVKNETIRFIERRWGTGAEIEIITGNSNIMKSIVIHVLKEYKVDFFTGKFYTPNSGRIIAWLE
jgi:hypothetical protein